MEDTDQIEYTFWAVESIVFAPAHRSVNFGIVKIRRNIFVSRCGRTVLIKKCKIKTQKKTFSFSLIPF